MRVLFRLNNWLITAMTWFAVLMVALMMLAITVEVVLRAIHGGAVAGLVEGTEYALYFSTFLSIPGLLRSNEHIRIDLLLARLPPGGQRALERFGAIAIVVVSAILAWYGAKLLVDHIIDGRLIFKDVVLPQWWLDWAVPLSALTTGLLALEHLIAPPPPIDVPTGGTGG